MPSPSLPADVVVQAGKEPVECSDRLSEFAASVGLSQLESARVLPELKAHPGCGDQ